MAKTNITEATDADLFLELDNCKVAKVLLSKTAYKNQWQKYETALKNEIAERSKEYSKLTDAELLNELMA